MPLDTFKAEGLLFNTNFVEATSQPGITGFRGELVLVKGEIGDSMGHSKPPVEVMRGATLLADDKIKMLVGSLDEVASLNTLVEKYQSYFAPDMKSVLYVVNIPDPVKVEINGIEFVLIPLVQGMPWNELIDELGLEKSDFKGQSASDKILTIYKELQQYKPKYPLVTLDEAMANITDAKHESWGAV